MWRTTITVWVVSAAKKGVYVTLWLDVVEELVMRRKELSWRHVPSHPWGDILVWLDVPHNVYPGHEKSVGGGWTAHPDYQNFEARLAALIQAHGEHHEANTTHP